MEELEKTLREIRLRLGSARGKTQCVRIRAQHTGRLFALYVFLSAHPIDGWVFLGVLPASRSSRLVFARRDVAGEVEETFRRHGRFIDRRELCKRVAWWLR